MLMIMTTGVSIRHLTSIAASWVHRSVAGASLSRFIEVHRYMYTWTYIHTWLLICGRWSRRSDPSPSAVGSRLWRCIDSESQRPVLGVFDSLHRGSANTPGVGTRQQRCVEGSRLGMGPLVTRNWFLPAGPGSLSSPTSDRALTHPTPDT